MAKPDGASGNETEALLAEPEVQRLVAEIDRRIGEGLKKLAAEARDPSQAFLAELAPLWGRTLLTHPTAIFVSKFALSPDGPPEIEAGIVVNTGEETLKLRASLVRLQDEFLKGKVKEVEIVGTKCFRFQIDEDAPEITWGSRGKYLLVGIGQGSMEAIFDNVRKPPPAWLTELKKRLPVERTSSITYSNLQASVAAALEGMGSDGAEAMRIVNSLGLGNVTTYGAVTGLDQDGFVSRTLINFDGEARGILTLVDGKPLTAADLAPIPADSNIAVAFRLNADKVMETALALAKEISPDAAEEIDENLAMANQMLGLDIQKDIAQSLGDAWCVYNSPEEGGTFFTGLTATVSLRDHAQAAKAEKQLLALATAALRGPDGEEGFDPDMPRLKQIKFGEHMIHYVTSGEMPLAPAWCLTESQLVVSLMPQNIEAFLSRGEDYKSIAKNAAVAPLLSAKDGPLAVTYIDTPKLFEMFYPFGQIMAQAAFSKLQREGFDIDASILPMSQSISRHLRPSVGSVRRTADGIEFTREQTLPGSSAGSTTPVMVALLVPAVQAARSAARRSQSLNNMRQIGLAMVNHESATKRFPADFKTKDGKPGLSWRVRILPYIEEIELYRQFHLDEPWDSEHNLKLLERMPASLRSPNSKAAPGMTNYLGVGGEHGIFAPSAKGTTLREIGDGISRTAALVEVDDELALPWTKPGDYEPDAMKLKAGLGHLQSGNIFLVLFADCHVMAVSNDVDEKALKAMFTKNAGDAFDEDALHGAAARRPRAIDDPDDEVIEVEEEPAEEAPEAEFEFVP